MDTYIKQWFDILNGMSNDNTYKLAWGRAIIECISIDESIMIEDFHRIDFKNIAHHMIKYYWNQTFFFNLKQSSNSEKKPVVVQHTEKLIEYYKLNVSNNPIWFDKGIIKIPTNLVENTINSVSSVLTENVSWRFPYINHQFLNLYVLNLDERYIDFNKDNYQSLKSYAEILTQLFNYKWAQLLERYNTQPRIVSKVKGSSDNVLKRNNLSKYKDILLGLYHDEIKDFYTDEVISLEEVSVDHFIPWSFMYSDDLWNLVITSKSNNSSKSNRPPEEAYIKKLEERNMKLLEIIQDSKQKEELLESLEHHYITKFYQSLIS